MAKEPVDAVVEVLVPDAPWMETWLTPDQQLEHQRQLFHQLVNEVGIDETKERWEDWEALMDESGEVPFPTEDWESIIQDRLYATHAQKPAKVMVIDSKEEYDADEMKDRLKAMGVPNP